MSDREGVKPGTQPRGERHAITARVPDEQYAAYKSAAEELGIPIGSYIAMLAADVHNLPRPAYIVKELERAQEKRRIAARRSEQASLDLEVPMAHAS